MKDKNPFGKCPVYETENLIFTKVKVEDAVDLFQCYSDPITRSHMNNDNCGGEWDCHSIDVIKQGIRSWEQEFEDKFYIRWSVKYKPTNKKIGTIEIAPVPNTTRFLDGVCQIGILRVDIISILEKEKIFSEIFNMATNNFYLDFDINSIITKATQDDIQRVVSLKKCNYKRLEDYKIIPYRDYYIKNN